jgi:hypothetical protein
MTGFRLAARRDVITEPPMGAAMMPSEIQMGAVHVAGEHFRAHEDEDGRQPGSRCTKRPHHPGQQQVQGTQSSSG